jgi:hypothetical protein
LLPLGIIPPAIANSSNECEDFRMKQNLLLDFEKGFVGRACSVVYRGADWALYIDGGGSIALGAPWRIVCDGRIVLTDEDDGQKFGLATPVDAQAKANDTVFGKAIEKISVNAETADLAIYFDGSLRIDVFNNSSGYEAWQAQLPSDCGGRLVVALGGGGIAIYEEGANLPN